MIGLRGETSQRESQAVRSAGKLANARLQHCGAPCNSAAEHAVFSHNFAYQELWNTVLQCDHDTIFGKEVFQKGNHLGIVLLFCHQEDDIVLPAHCRRSVSRNLLGEFQSAHDSCSILLKGFHVGFIPVDQINLTAVFSNECAKYGSHGTGAVNSYSHCVFLFTWITNIISIA